MTEEHRIFYILGESRAAVLPSLFVDKLRKTGLELLYMVDPSEGYCMLQSTEFDGKTLKPTTPDPEQVDDERDERLRNRRPGRVSRPSGVDKGDSGRQGG